LAEVWQKNKSLAESNILGFIEIINFKFSKKQQKKLLAEELK
jgi:hypothetical protein